jgi:hypothetical protein
MATFSTDATAEDAVVFYQATLTAAGFTPVADSGPASGSKPSRELRFDNPTAGFPTPDEALLIEATINVATEPGAEVLSLTLGTLFAYDDYSPDELASTVRAALPSGGFSIDVENDSGSGSPIALRHIALDDVTWEIGPGESSPATLLLSGTVTL